MTTSTDGNSKRPSLRIIWISSIILDLDAHFHKTSQIEILKHLSQLGHDVYFITRRSKKRNEWKNFNFHVVAIPIRYVQIVAQIIYGLFLTLFLPLYIIKKRPNIIVTDPVIPIFSFFWKPVISRFVKFKMILDIRSTPVATSGLSGVLRIFQFNISAQCTKIIFDGLTIITSAMRKEVCEKFNLTPKSVGVWSSAASTELFDYEKNVHYGYELRNKFGLSNKFVVFYHGTLAKTRGIIQSIEAIMIVKKKYPDIVLFLLGASSDTYFLKNVIQKCGVQENVFLHDSVDYKEVPKYIALSDIGIVPLPNIPDWRNQCPLKLLEYLAMKRPVIVTDIPANREVVREEKCGIYVSPCDPVEITKGLAKAMEYAYENKEELKRWGELGRTIIDHEYNWNESAKNLETYLLKVMSQSSGQ